MYHRMIRPVFTFLLIAIVVSSLLGCNLIKVPQIQGALATLSAGSSEQVTATTKASEGGKATIAGKATAEDSASTTPKATTASKATAVPKATTKPKATAKPVAQELVILEQGFGQEEADAAYAMVVENPGESALMDSQFQVTFYDADGAVLDTEQGYLGLILAGQSLGIAGNVYLDDGQVIDTMEIMIEPGDAVDADFNAPLSTDQASFIEGEYYSSAYGIVSNPFDQDMRSVDAWVVAYDADGNIIGGGSGYLNFIPAGESTGVALSLASSGPIDRVDLYAAVANATFYDDSADRVGVENVSLVNSGYGQKDNQVAYGALIENASADAAATSISVHVTVYDGSGTVIAVEDNYIQLILPGETQAFASTAYLGDGLLVGSVEFIFRVDTMAPASDLPYLTSTNINYQPDDYSPKVTGQIENPYDVKLEYVQVVVIAYDADGAIIGGGTGYIDFISAGKKAAVEVYITTSSEPDSFEMYATANQLSDLQ